MTNPDVDWDAIPERFRHLTTQLGSQDPLALPSNRPLLGEKWAAVLIALSDTDDPDLIITERSHSLRKHPGQLAFPGGGAEEGDGGPVGTALREAQEEVGLDPASIHVLGVLPAAAVPVSRYDVVGVVGYWDGKQHLAAVDRAEVASVHRWTISQLTDPDNRVSFLHTSGHTGPAWIFGDYFLWGFTAYVVDHVLRLAGWEKPWDAGRLVEVPKRFRSDRAQVTDQ